MSETARTPISVANGSERRAARRPTATATRARRAAAAAPRSTQSEQRDQEERRDVEQVPLLDAQRVARRERGDLDEQPRREHGRCRRGTRARAGSRLGRERAGAAGSAANGTTPSERSSSATWQKSQREHLDEVVRLLAGDAVRAEQVERRAAAHDLRERGRATAAAAGQPRTAADQRARPTGARRRRARAARAASPGRSTSACARVTNASPTTPSRSERPRIRRRPLERAARARARREEERVERVLGHQRPRVEERRERDREDRDARRAPGCEHDAAREEVRGHDRERDRDAR